MRSRFGVGFLTIIALTGCGSLGHRSESTLMSTSSTIVVRDSFGNPAATITSSILLENAAFKTEGGWDILSWKSPGNGTAAIHMTPGQVINVSLDRGIGVVIEGDQNRLLTSGSVSGTLTYVCGPQGSRCQVDIPPLVGDLTYPCGPQGAICRVSIPGVPSESFSVTEDTYVCGPQGARCPRPLPSDRPAQPVICGPQGARCG
jgi:hypothetical protein